jgi:SAM-dependent methyltransferase
MESLGPKAYQENAVQAFMARFDTRGRTILEVGGSNLPRDYIFDVLQPAQWVSVDPIPTDTLDLMRAGEREPYLDHLRSIGISRSAAMGQDWQKPYVIVAEPVEDLADTLFQRFDLAFSVACFEHIHALEAAVSVIHGALRPGGSLFTEYSPVWSSHEGHHCDWIPHHRRPASIVADQGRVPPFGHLLNTPAELRTLLEPHFEPDQLDWVIQAIYRDGYINRLFHDDYLRIMKQSRFDEVTCRSVWPVEVAPATLQVLAAAYPGQGGFKYQGLQIVATRTR